MTREALIVAMLDRWLQREQQRFDEIVGSSPSPSDRVRAHIQATAVETTEASSRMAALLAVLAGSGHQAEGAARWYAKRSGNFAATTPQERHMRIAFLAAEGAFFVRHLAGIPMSDELWQDIFDDLSAFTADWP